MLMANILTRNRTEVVASNFLFPQHNRKPQMTLSTKDGDTLGVSKISTRRDGGQKRIMIVLIALSALVSIQPFFADNLSEINERKIALSKIPRSISGQDIQTEERPRERDAPMWSASKRQQSKNLTEFDAHLKWRFPGVRKNVHQHRGATEILTYGLTGVLPWFGSILPALRFEVPLEDASKIEQVQVDGIIDVYLDLHQCSVGRDEESGPDGYYDVCFPNVTGRTIANSLCFLPGVNMRPTTRIRDYPAPGHERWSCSDHSLIEQLVAAQILDYIVTHGDRFYSERTNNLFISSTERPIKFVSIDHEAAPCKFFRQREFEKYAGMKELLDYQLPLELRNDLKRVFLLGSKDEFVQKVNATIDGQFDNLNRIMIESLHRDNCRPEKGEDPRDLAYILWERLESVARFYNITGDD